MEDILNIFQQFGFPAACVVVLFIQNNKFSTTLAELSNTLSLMNERLKDIETKVKGASDESNS